MRISSNGISTWKATGSYPRADVAVKIAKVLGVSVEYLVAGKIPNVEYEDALAYDVSRLPEKKEKVHKNNHRFPLRLQLKKETCVFTLIFFNSVQSKRFSQ